MPEHTVAKGECLYSIAERFGFSYQSLWNLPENEELRAKRKDPNVLFPGDKVFVPEPRARRESASTDARHRFRRKDVPEVMRVILEDHHGRPFSDVEYRAVFDTLDEHTGTVPPDGLVEHKIPTGARSCEIMINVPVEAPPSGQGETIEATGVFADDERVDGMADSASDDNDDEPEATTESYVYNVMLGYLDPVTEPTGVQQRLANLGYDCGPDDGVIGSRTKSALKEFQKQQGLPCTGEVDSDTRATLERVHHS